jgi:ssDNA-binding Zn-finger/Zn-ribbon topoisomerase 1
MPGYGVDKYWNQSDQKHWFIKCSNCNYEQFMDWEKNVDRELGQYVCQKCHKVLTDENRRVGRWVKKWSDKEISGYWINQMMVSWLSCKELLNTEANKDKQYFNNFILGIPYRGSDIVVNRDLILRNITQWRSTKTDVAIGVDVGMTKHVVVGTPYGIFQIFKTNSWEEIENVFLKYDATMVIDALPDLTEPRRLMEKYKGRVFLNFYKADAFKKEIFTYQKEKQYGYIRTDRTRMIQRAIDDLTAGDIKFHLRPEELGEYIEHWESLSRLQEEDKLHNPVIRWESATGVDHFVHATVYYLIASGRAGVEGAVFKERTRKLGRESYFVDENGRIPAMRIEEDKPKKDWRYV